MIECIKKKKTETSNIFRLYCFGGIMKIAITAESTIDLPFDLLRLYEINTIPFTVILGDKEFQDGQIDPESIFRFVDDKKILPKTSAINKESYLNFFKDILTNVDAVVHIGLSSQISSSYENAKNASNELENVYVVDSLSLSTGIALLAIYARKLVDSGLDAEEVYKKVSARVPSVQASFVLERLDYLYKGGRCSALSYFGANLLKIRPQILVKNGKMGSYKKYRGSMDKVVEDYCRDTLNEFNKPDLEVAFLTYTTATDRMVENARKALQKRGFKTIYETHAGATISSHCGEHTLGILYINDGGSDNEK